MRTIRLTSQFKKDLKREKKGIYKEVIKNELPVVLDLLARDVTLPAKFVDHPLIGQKKHLKLRDCHIRPDLLLIYRKTDEGELLILELIRLGSHSELF
ncbi:type II toxin-antitoxin system YafQ family toxin [Pelistega europaea]|uniref:Type II toxin-antitoxin system YafQ family toxin n=1 Tax=Pelistega europaea TaxID=106147 RepID=A0A7Y4LBA2_9BURK|nr:type II toxin-antitoxin system YafQ family toxin [Pelistega europaea]NOL49267.1 type II toxin-antitoxin system YafQ family toxin [Pelistega europaea]